MGVLEQIRGFFMDKAIGIGFTHPSSGGNPALKDRVFSKLRLAGYEAPANHA
jgi:hypothetical protein